jgi:serine/threonine protein kinase
MELAAGGELFRRLSKKENFSPHASRFYSIEIFSILEHVHAMGYVYRDLKPENVMLDENGHCKLVDFGFATRPDSSGLCHTNVGTPAYLSPEQLNGKFTNGYTKIVDWWSLGCFVFELLTGLTPFCRNNRETQYAIYLRVLKGKISFPRKMDAESKDLVSQLCSADLTKRLCEPAEIKNHAFFSAAAGNWDKVKKLKLVPPFVPRIRDEGDDRHFDDYGTHFQDRIDGGADCVEYYEGF